MDIVEKMKVENQIVDGKKEKDKEAAVSLNKIVFRHPGEIVFGAGSFNQFIEDFLAVGNTRLFVLAIPVLKEFIENKKNLFLAPLFLGCLRTYRGQFIYKQTYFLSKLKLYLSFICFMGGIFGFLNFIEFIFGF